jgi:hypothetical protein
MRRLNFEEVTCKGSQALDKAVRMAREVARGADQASTVGFFSGGISDEERFFPSGCTYG